VSHDAWHIKAASAVIDGEIVVPAANGTTDFSVLQNELKGQSTKIVMVAFDLLYLNGRDLRKMPLHQRKAELKKIIAGTDIQFSESFEIDGQAMFAHACKLGLKGVVSKVRDSVYLRARRRRASDVDGNEGGEHSHRNAQASDDRPGRSRLVAPRLPIE
jgi:bifunctional non-homologous end joining protein LigD